MGCVLSASRTCTVASEWGEAGEDGTRAGDATAGATATGAAVAGTGGGTQPAAAQQRSACLFDVYTSFIDLDFIGTV